MNRSRIKRVEASLRRLTPPFWWRVTKQRTELGHYVHFNTNAHLPGMKGERVRAALALCRSVADEHASTTCAVLVRFWKWSPNLDRWVIWDEDWICGVDQ